MKSHKDLQVLSDMKLEQRLEVFFDFFLPSKQFPMKSESHRSDSSSVSIQVKEEANQLPQNSVSNFTLIVSVYLSY